MKVALRSENFDDLIRSGGALVDASLAGMFGPLADCAYWRLTIPCWLRVMDLTDKLNSLLQN